MRGFALTVGVAQAAGPDVVIPVRPGDNNPHLRYTLRSIAAHVPHRRVWIAGHMPPWVRGVGHIPTAQRHATKYQNSRSNWKAAFDHPEVTDQVLIFNDDFFVMRDLPGLPPVWHRGRCREVYAHFERQIRRPGRYMLGMRQTMDLLADLGHDDPLCYELHVPMLIERERYLEVWEIAQRIKYPHSRTLYGVLNHVGGTQMRDPKITHTGPHFNRGSLFLSTMSSAFQRGQVGAYIRSVFPAACRYEAPPARRRTAAGHGRPTRPASSGRSVGGRRAAGGAGGGR